MSKIDESLFVKPIKDGSPLKCPICFGVVDHPFRLPCSHVFCNDCIGAIRPTKSVEGEKLLCPMDRKPFTMDQITPERYLQEIIEELDVVCVHKDKGCTWTGEYQTLAAHQHNNCEFEEVECPNKCGFKKSRKFLGDHKNECAARIVPCPSCGSWSGEFRELDNHFKACVDAVVPCPMSAYGCTHTGPRVELTKHLSESLANHFTYVVQQLEASREREKALEKKVEELTTRVQQIAMGAATPQPGAGPVTHLSTFNTTNPPNTAVRAPPARGINPANTAHVQAIKNVVSAMTADIHPGTHIPSTKIRDCLNVAIFGNGPGLKGGAHVYDAGNHQLCFDIYAAVAEQLVQLPNALSYPYAALLINGLNKAATEAAPLGTRNDAAWILRDAFERVKRLP